MGLNALSCPVRTPCDGERYFNNHSLLFQSKKVVNNKVHIKGKRKIEKVCLQVLPAGILSVSEESKKEILSLHCIPLQNDSVVSKPQGCPQSSAYETQ